MAEQHQYWQSGWQAYYISDDEGTDTETESTLFDDNFADYHQKFKHYPNRNETLNYSGSTGQRSAVGEKSCIDPREEYDADSSDVAKAKATPKAKESADTTSSTT